MNREDFHTRALQFPMAYMCGDVCPHPLQVRSLLGNLFTVSNEVSNHLPT